MKLPITLTVALFSVAIGTALTGLAVSSRAQQDMPALENLKRIQEAGKKFQTKKFRLLWAREAYRCGNADSAFKAWKALAEQGSLEATFILGVFSEWGTLADDGSRAAQYAMRLFRPGDGTAKTCKL